MSQNTPAKELFTEQYSNQQNEGVTYDDGEGIKDRIVMSGPLSEVIAAQLNVIFKKQVITTDGEPGDAPIVSTESMQQYATIQGAFEDSLSQPENEVVLTGYDVMSVKEHLNRMLSNKLFQKDDENITTVPVVVVTEDDLLEPTTLMDFILKSTDELLIVKDRTANAPEHMFLTRNTNNNTTRFLDNTNTPAKPLVYDEDELTVSDKMQALERMYGDKVKHIHFGVKAFVKSLRQRKVKAV